MAKGFYINKKYALKSSIDKYEKLNNPFKQIIRCCGNCGYENVNSEEPILCFDGKLKF